jgi:hypothetical protein
MSVEASHVMPRTDSVSDEWLWFSIFPFVESMTCTKVTYAEVDQWLTRVAWSDPKTSVLLNIAQHD